MLWTVVVDWDCAPALADLVLVVPEEAEVVDVPALGWDALEAAAGAGTFEPLRAADVAGEVAGAPVVDVTGPPDPPPPVPPPLGGGDEDPPEQARANAFAGFTDGMVASGESGPGS